MLVLALTLLAQAASPAPTNTAAAPAATAANDPSAVVCHSESATGHRIEAKVCHTRAEWDRLERDSARFMHGIPQSACKTAVRGGPC